MWPLGWANGSCSSMTDRVQGAQNLTLDPNHVSAQTAFSEEYTQKHTYTHRCLRAVVHGFALHGMRAQHGLVVVFQRHAVSRRPAVSTKPRIELLHHITAQLDTCLQGGGAKSGVFVRVAKKTSADGPRRL